MNFPAKIKRMQAEIDELRARVAALERGKSGYSYGEPFTLEGELLLSQKPWDLQASSKAIDVAPSIASATIAPPPKKRGRPPKA